MSFLAPWAFGIAAIAAAATIVLHLVARTRPAAYVLPTARFIPDRRTLVSRVATTPRDLVLLALRALVLLAAGAAFARPVLTPSRVPLARVVLVDVSSAQGDVAETREKVRVQLGITAPTTVIAFDTVARETSALTVDSLLQRSDKAAGSLSVALIAARRAGAALAERADSVQLVLVSPVAGSEVDAATSTLRHEWPGRIAIERTLLTVDTAMRSSSLERRVPVSDPLGPSLVGYAVGAAPFAVRLVRGTFAAADSADARAGMTVVRWDSSSAESPLAAGLALGDDVIVAPLSRLRLGSGGRDIARWADGPAAAREWRLGSGCLREVGIGIPGAGDLPLHPPFQRIVRGLVSSCNLPVAYLAASDSELRALQGTGGPALASAFGVRAARPSPLARWLLVAALVLALVEMAVRAREPMGQTA